MEMNWKSLLYPPPSVQKYFTATATICGIIPETRFLSFCISALQVKNTSESLVPTFEHSRTSNIIEPKRNQHDVDSTLSVYLVIKNEYYLSADA